MIRKSLILVAATQLVAAFIFSEHSFAALVIHTTKYSDGLTTGVWNGPMSATVSQAATLKTINCPRIDGGFCYQALIDKKYIFTYADTITLPQVGETFQGGFFDQTFHDTTRTHENWHKAYIGALLDSTYGALQTWSNSYYSNWFQTEAAALAAGNADLATSLTIAKTAFVADYSSDVDKPELGHQNAVAVLQTINGVETWRSKNPDWGKPAVDYAKSIVVSFTKTAGDCECVPEPSSIFMFTGMIGMGFVGYSRRKGRSACRVIRT
jgi:hypothetical protein